MTLEELSIRFTADAQPLTAKLSQLSGLMSAASAQAGALEAAFYASGSRAGAGLAGGILSQKGAVTAAAQAVARAAESALRAALKIHSPSKVTQDMGARFDEGFALGIRGAQTDAQDAAVHMSALSLDALRLPKAQELPAASFQKTDERALAAAFSDAARQISITVPLEVDGYRLGVAAANGLNRVRASTGRFGLTL